MTNKREAKDLEEVRNRLKQSIKKEKLTNYPIVKDIVVKKNGKK